MKKVFYLLIPVILIVASCTGDVQPQDEKPEPAVEQDLSEYGDFVLNEGVFFYGKTLTPHIKIIDEDTVVMTGMPQAHIPSPGSVIFCPITEETPYGYFGRVVSVNGNSFHMEAASLTDVFRELDLQADDIDLAEHTGEFYDEDGNKVESDTVDNAFWEELDEEGLAQENQTKADYSGRLKTTAIAYSSTYTEGHLYVKQWFSVHILIGGASLKEFDLRYQRRSSLEGTFTGGKANTKTIELKKVNAPIGTPIPIGALFCLQPEVFVDAKIDLEGSMMAKGKYKFELENTISTMTYKNKKLVSSTTKGPRNNWLKVNSIELKGELKPSVEVGVGLAAPFRKVFRLALSGTLDMPISANMEYSIDNPSLVALAPKLNVNPTVSANLYCTSELLEDLTGTDIRLGYSKNLDLPSFQMPLLPVFRNGNMHKKKSQQRSGYLSEGKYSCEVTVEVDENSFMPAERVGMAFFTNSSQEPVSIIWKGDPEYSPEQDGQDRYTFAGSCDYARPAVLDREGIIRYGDRIEALSKMPIAATYYMSNGEGREKILTNQLSWDSKGRLVSSILNMVGTSQMTVSYSYPEDSSLIKILTINDGVTISGEYILSDNGNIINLTTVQGSARFNYDEHGHLVDCIDFYQGNNYSVLNIVWNGDLISAVSALGGSSVTCYYNDDSVETPIFISALTSVLAIGSSMIGSSILSVVDGLSSPLAFGSRSAKLPSSLKTVTTNSNGDTNTTITTYLYDLDANGNLTAINEFNSGGSTAITTFEY